MAPTEADLLAARLTRIKTMIDRLEHACIQSAEQRTLFDKIHAEMAAARAALKIVYPPGFAPK